MTERRCAQKPIARRMGCAPAAATKPKHVPGEMTPMEFWTAMGKADMQEPKEPGVLLWHAILSQGTVNE